MRIYVIIQIQNTWLLKNYSSSIIFKLVRLRKNGVKKWFDELYDNFGH